jgi:hypothetical protein
MMMGSQVMVESAHIRHKSSVIVSGPSGSGKTEFIYKLLLNKDTKIIPPPEIIVYCYGIYQKRYDDMRGNIGGIIFVKGLVDIEKLDTTKRHLLILDDLMGKCDEDKLCDIFTRGCHHANTTCVYVTQNLFHQSPKSRTISLNAKYFILFKSPRDAKQVSYLADQIYPQKRDKIYFMSAYTDATSTSYSYLFVDLTQMTDDAYRLRGDIFGETESIYIRE